MKKIELKKVNKPDGTHWYGIWINGSCQIPAYGTDLEKAKEAYELMKKNLAKDKPEYETIQTDEI